MQRIARTLKTKPLRFFGTIGDGSSAFSKKGSAQEEKFIHDHEVEVMKAFKKNLSKQKPEEPKVETTNEQAPPASFYVHGGSGPLGNREAAAENAYIRRQDNEKIHHLHEELEAKKKK
jgi:hypothetical protein